MQNKIINTCIFSKVNKDQRLYLRKVLIRLDLNTKSFCPTKGTLLCFMGGTKEISFPVGLNWRQGFLFSLFINSQLATLPKNRSFI